MIDPIVGYGRRGDVSHAPDWFVMYGVHILIAHRDLRRGTGWFHQRLGPCHSHSGCGIQGFGWSMGHSASW